MNKLWLIVKREYITRVRKKSFIIVTLLAPFSIILLIGAQVFFMTYGKEKMDVAIMDETGYFVSKLDNGRTVTNIEDSKSRNLYFKSSDVPIEELKENYKELGFSGVLHIDKSKFKIGSDSPAGVSYFSDDILGTTNKSYVENNLSKRIRNLRIEQEGVNKQFLDRLKKIDITLKEPITEEDGAENKNLVASMIGGGMGFLMYMVIIIYGAMVLRGVMEEKTNRIVEIILSSVKPFKLMLGKILGIGAVGLTQLVIWIGSMVVIYVVAGIFMAGNVDVAMDQMPQNIDISEFEAQAASLINTIGSLPIAWIVTTFIFYFLTGYVFYAALFAAVGSAVGDDGGDSQSLMFPIMVPIIISFFILTAILDQPNSGLAFWSSMIPFSSPIIMPARIALGAPIWEVLLSMVTMIGGIFATTWLAAKIYRVGILMYGNKISIKQIGRWLKYS